MIRIGFSRSPTSALHAWPGPLQRGRRAVGGPHQADGRADVPVRAPSPIALISTRSIRASSSGFSTSRRRRARPWLARFVPLMRSVDLTDDLPRIRCPMLAVVPDHDPISSMAQYEVIRERVRQGEVRGLPRPAPQHHRRGPRPLRQGAAPLPARAALSAQEPPWSTSCGGCGARSPSPWVWPP